MTRFHDRVTLERRGRVALILLDRPERLNAFDGELYQGLNEALHTFRDDDELWAAVIGSSSSRAFSAGVDIKALNAHAEAGRLQGVGGLDIDGNMFTNKPMIAAVEGHCVGEGVNLALGCDLIIADEPYPKFELVPTRLIFRLNSRKKWVTQKRLPFLTRAHLKMLIGARGLAW